MNEVLLQPLLVPQHMGQALTTSDTFESRAHEGNLLQPSLVEFTSHATAIMAWGKGDLWPSWTWPKSPGNAMNVNHMSNANHKVANPSIQADKTT